MANPPLDGFQRRIDYLRVSVTDLCNLRCIYCMPEGGVPKLRHEEILRYEEILRLTRVAIGMGITKVRITGGEPLVRRDVLYLCEQIARHPELKSLSLTTNGVLLADFADDLYRVGIKRVNISLDTLNSAKYAAVTGKDRFQDVWRGIETAHEVGFAPIKLNTVVMRGVNDDEIEDLARITCRYPFHVRFIEFMPFQPSSDQHYFLSSDEILARLQRLAPLNAARSRNSNGPARYFSFPDAPGKIGIISPVSHHFCPTCNRLRLTADGKLRTCLFASEETDLRKPLREGAGDDELAGIIRAAVAAKPEKHSLDDSVFRKCISRPMSAIGG